MTNPVPARRPCWSSDSIRTTAPLADSKTFRTSAAMAAKLSCAKVVCDESQSPAKARARKAGAEAIRTLGEPSPLPSADIFAKDKTGWFGIELKKGRNPTQLPCGQHKIKSWPVVGSSRVADQECNGDDWRRRVEWSGNLFEISFPAGRAGSLHER